MSSPSLDNLRRDVGRLSAAVAALSTPAIESTELVDQTEQVSVELDPATGRIVNVRLKPQWKQHLGVEALGPTILSLPLQARLRATAETLAGANASAAASEPADVPTLRYDLPPSAMSQLTELRVSVAHHTRVFQALPPDERYVEPAEPDEAARSDNGMVEAVVVSGSVTQLRFDERWLDRAPIQAICEAVLQALQAAYAALDSDAATSDPAARLSPAGRQLKQQADEIFSILDTYRSR